ncbi:unnamed protein product [Arctogadus glacialis]
MEDDVTAPQRTNDKHRWDLGLHVQLFPSQPAGLKLHSASRAAPQIPPLLRLRSDGIRTAIHTCYSPQASRRQDTELKKWTAMADHQSGGTAIMQGE